MLCTGDKLSKDFRFITIGNTPEVSVHSKCDESQRKQRLRRSKCLLHRISLYLREARSKGGRKNIEKEMPNSRTTLHLFGEFEGVLREDCISRGRKKRWPFSLTSPR